MLVMVRPATPRLSLPLPFPPSKQAACILPSPSPSCGIFSYSLLATLYCPSRDAPPALGCWQPLQEQQALLAELQAEASTGLAVCCGGHGCAW